MTRFLLAASACVSVMVAQGATGQGADVLLNCSTCHTVGSGSSMDAATQRVPSPYPNLNGQPVRYLERQLEAYRTGLRQHPQMQATTTALGDGSAAMARMYADAASPKLALQGDVSAYLEAQKLIAEGDWSRGLPSCASCHGMNEEDRARLAPRLHGHPEGYLARQLRAYADGTRQSDTMGRMRSFASRLTEAEIAALAAYYAAWRAESSESTNENGDQPDG